MRQRPFPDGIRKRVNPLTFLKVNYHSCVNDHMTPFPSVIIYSSEQGTKVYFNITVHSSNLAKNTSTKINTFLSLKIKRRKNMYVSELPSCFGKKKIQQHLSRICDLLGTHVKEA